jgi:hypothetical protein
VLVAAVPEQPLPVAEGRLVTALAWLGGSSCTRLLAVAAPFPDSGLEPGKGSVLVELEVGGVGGRLWRPGPSAAA